MKIEDLTIKEARELASLFSKQSTTDSPYEIGECYFVRTVTYHSVGRLVDIRGDVLVFEKASMIADSKRFWNFLTNWRDKEPEIEPIPGLHFVHMGAITDATEWTQDLPEKQQ